MIMNYRSILICYCLLLSSFSIDHGIYISVFEVHHNVNQKKGEIIIKTFSDDLTNALRAMNFNIPQDADPCIQKDALSVYIDSHFEMEINDSVITWSIVDCQLKNDTHWIYLKYATPELMTNITISTDWLTELFGNQQNIIKVRVGESKKNQRLSSEQTEAIFDF